MAIVHPPASPPKSSSQAYVPQFSPLHLGYRRAAEWESHDAVWLAWPHREASWHAALEKVESFYVQLVKMLARYEAVHLIVPTTDAVAPVRVRLAQAGCPNNYQLHVMSFDSGWIRDYGAMFVSRLDDTTALPKRVAVDWGFNGWGRSDLEYDSDNAVAARMANAMHVPSVSGGMVLEGGAVDVNGQGTMLVTESSVLDLRKNGNANREWVEAKAATMLGVSQVIWLASGVVGDASGGRVDQVARFVAPNRIALVVEPNKSSLNYDVLEENRQRLSAARNASGRPFDLVSLPAPVTFAEDEQHATASYASFYIANGCVLVPEYGYPTDQTARSTVQSLFPGRKMLGIDCRSIVQPQGSLHGLTQHVPAA